MNATRWHVYLLECDGRVVYTGITTDVARRVAEHTAGGSRAARFTRRCRELRLLYSVEIGERALAARVENRLKRKQRRQKLAIAEAKLTRGELLEILRL